MRPDSRWLLPLVVVLGCSGEAAVGADAADVTPTDRGGGDVVLADAAPDTLVAPDAAQDDVVATDAAIGDAVDAALVADVADGGDPPPPPLTVTRVEWNATGMNLGAVQAVAEDGDLTAVYTDQGLRLLVAGAVAARDDSVRSWRTAITAAAADGTPGSWILGADAMSRVFRVRDRSTLEDVTSRLALGMRDIQSAARVSDDAVAFGGSGGFAVLRGSNVAAWNDPDFVQIVGGGNRVAAANSTGVKVFDLMTERAVRYGVTGVTGFALSRAGLLIIAVGARIYEQNMRGELAPVYTHPAELRTLAVSGDNTWLIADNRLALWDGFRVRTTADVTLASTARLIPASNGGVWVLQGGVLSRYTLVVDPEDQRWNTEIRSIFATRCTPCHLPGGTAGIDLSTRCAWAVRRDAIRDQVNVRMLMPPSPATMPAQERSAIAAYLASLSPDACGGVRDAGPRMDAAQDATSDVPRDSGADVRMDAGADVPRDAPRDVAADVRMDAGADVPRDAAADVRVDAAMDVPRDVAADVRVDVAADVPRDVPRDTGPADAGTPAYAAVQAIFNASCTSCHGGSGALNLGASVSYANLVNVAAAGGSCASSGMLRVTPGDPMNSLLFRKVAATQPCGNAMPRSGPLAPADVEIIRRWIAGGAPR